MNQEELVFFNDLKSKFENLDFKDIDCAGTNQTILLMAEMARRYGLLSLENLLPFIKEPIYRNSIQLMVDGESQENVLKLLNALIEKRMFQTIRYLNCLKEGLSQIQEIGNPRTLKKILDAISNIE